MYQSNKVSKFNKPTRQYNPMQGERMEKDRKLSDRRKSGRYTKQVLQQSDFD